MFHLARELSFCIRIFDGRRAFNSSTMVSPTNKVAYSTVKASNKWQTFGMTPNKVFLLGNKPNVNLISLVRMKGIGSRLWTLCPLNDALYSKRKKIPHTRDNVLVFKRKMSRTRPSFSNAPRSTLRFAY